MNKKNELSNKSVSDFKDEFMVTNEVLRFLNISRSTLYRLMYQEKIQPYHVGVTLRFRKSEIRHYVDTGSPERKSMDNLLRDDRFYSPNEIMECLKISRSTLLRLIESGELRAKVIQRQYRFSREDILAVLKPVDENYNFSDKDLSNEVV